MKYSLIIPCYNEGENVERIAGELMRCLPADGDWNIWFMDDSTDDTTARLERLSKAKARVHYVHRTGERGLSAAVIDGFKTADGDIFVVMDADLQHPPEVVPKLLEQMEESGADIAIPSRFVPGGSDGGLNVFRKLVSWTARMMAKGALKKMRRITDPTSGFFAVRRQVVEQAELQPLGWKILLDILCRCSYRTCIEIPYGFVARDLGSSKMNLREQWNYIRHLISLIQFSREDARFWMFALVGLSGAIVNSAAYVLLVERGAGVNWSFAIATLLAIVNNFVWNSLYTWRHRQPGRTSGSFMDAAKRFLRFSAVSLAGLALAEAGVYIFHGLAGVHYFISGVLGIVISSFWNFVINDRWTFKKSAAEESHTPDFTPLNAPPAESVGK
ncbi:glycosyltransferase [Paenibacillus sp. TAB 01]|uniref:glycosyltransferase n=1 Tax=Paenibacillus sp. TAB 01 TaxID=3368988 RepID=UPI003751B6AE